jgi:signal peptidase I
VLGQRIALTLRMTRRFVKCLLLGVTFTAVGFGRETDATWIRGVFTGESPRPVVTSEPEAWQQASSIADDTPGAFVLVGSGHSMQPLYTPGTILVLRQLPFEELKRGQTVLYRSRARKVVAHVLIAKARDGWRVRGLNNRIHDMEPVQTENLVGVVVAAFKPVTVTRSRSASLATLRLPARPPVN